jgi:hypothetical protein
MINSNILVTQFSNSSFLGNFNNNKIKIRFRPIDNFISATDMEKFNEKKNFTN